MDERGFRRKLKRATLLLTLSLGLPLLALLALLLIMLWSARWVDHSATVIAEANMIERNLFAYQTSFRGYRLSGDKVFLGRLAATRAYLDPALLSLERSVSDNPGQVVRARTARAEIEVWFRFIDEELAKVREAPNLLNDAEFLRRGEPLFAKAEQGLAAFVEGERRVHSARDQGLRRIVGTLLGLLGIAALLGIPSLALWLRRLLSKVGSAYRAQVAAAELRTEQLRVSLNSIGDAVIATDQEGQITFLNPCAEKLMGWKNADAKGRVLSEVFQIFNEETGEATANPVERVLRENIVVGLANHTVLRSRDGREVPIEDSAAPIRGENGETLGVILVFHDVTEKRAIERTLRESERRLNFLNHLGEATRSLATAEAIMSVSTRMLGEHLRVSRCAYAEVERDNENFNILHDYTDGCASTVGTYHLSLFGPLAVAKMRGGETLVLRDVTKELTSDNGAGMFQAITIEAIICCPLVKESGLRAMMAVHQTKARDWTEAEISLVEEVVGRCWSTIERRRAQAALRASENLKTAILDTSLDGFILMNHEGRISDWNLAAEEIFGHARADVVGLSLGETIVPERLREAHRNGLARYLATRAGRILGRRLELPALRADGSEFPCELSINHIPGTEPPLFAGYARDLSEKKESEAALEAATHEAEAAALAVAESAERFRLLSEVVSLQVWTARPDGALDYANAECRQYFGTERDDDILGDGWAQFVHPEDLPQAARTWQKSISTGDHYEVEFRLRAADESYRWFLVRAESMRDSDGQIVKWFGTNTDIDDLKNAQAAAEHASRAKDNFLAVLSHELRTPLTPVLLSAAALHQDERLPGDVRAQLGMMERNIGLEARLIDDLLDLTRIEKGKLALRLQLCDAHSLIGLAVDIVRDDAQAKGISLENALDAKRSGLMLDQSRFQQVIWNLLRNAVKFTPERGRIAIRTRDSDDGDGAPTLTIEVSDSGVGIEPEALERIFQPFEQAGLSGDHRYGGIGLGLAIARAIVDLHGGSIRAESGGTGRGAVFVVNLPHATFPPEGMLEPSLNGRGVEDGHRIENENANLPRGLRLLVVEDHIATLQVLERLLRKAGHKVVAVSSVASALEAAAHEEFDLVISDLGLPDGTGNTLMRELRARYRLRGIALTGYGMEEDAERAREAGFMAHLIKPIEFDQLRRTLLPFQAEKR